MDVSIPCLLKHTSCVEQISHQRYNSWIEHPESSGVLRSMPS